MGHDDCNDTGKVGRAELYLGMEELVVLGVCVGLLPVDVTIVPPTGLSVASAH